MKKTLKKTQYTKGEIGKFKIMADFLPPPHLLIPREDNVKVTLTLSRRSLEFIKEAAEESHVPYQRMIRQLVDSYASFYNAQAGA